MCLSNLAVLANVHMIMATAPLYVNHIGGNEKFVGLVIGVFTITAMMIRPVAGMLLDKFGRKFLLFLGIALTAIVSGIYMLASTTPLFM